MTKILQQKKLLTNCIDSNGPICNNCGGSGYMKTSPNCYHTCFVCVGRGFMPQANN